MDLGREECPICLQQLEAPCITQCEHIFCSDCFVRALKQGEVHHRRQCPYCRSPVSLFSTIEVSSGSPLRRQEVDSIFGNTWLQHGQPGVASYHFESPLDCYISYTNAPPEWLLDDGSAPPARMPFVDPSYDAASRTFHGVIQWGSNPFNGSSRWEYQMVFSEDFSTICGGQMRAYNQVDEQFSLHRFPQELQYWRERSVSTVFGCAFVQASRLGLASYHFESPLDCYISYTNAPPEWLLDDGSAPPARMPFVDPSYDAASRTFHGVIDWGSNPFNGSSRWEYQMVFSEDFSTITAGHVLMFRADGTRDAPTLFGEHLFYERFIPEREELLIALQAQAERA